MRETYRILDANLNRAREALRVVEDCGRFVLNDPAITAMAKYYRSSLRELVDHLPKKELIVSRNIAGDIGTEMTSPTEMKRTNVEEVAIAACKRLTESLRTIEEYSKIIAPEVAVSVERLRYDAYTLEQRLSSRFVVGERFRNVRLYALISARFCAESSLREIARAAITGGAGALQLREKKVPDNVFLAMAAELRELTDETGTLLIINDRPDIAAIVGADGVHLGQGDLPIGEARRLLRPGAIIGQSTHSMQQAAQAVNEGADYIGFGAMFDTTTKDVDLVSKSLLKEIIETVPLPVVAVGGITDENVGQLVEVGCQCVAVCAEICADKDPKAATHAIRKQMPD
ncbi:MAG: thiamine phosphate synthase [Phycisphaerae bacterium]|nr:thiamine phosphate synthase [Phycisphaerae bacterium]